AIARRRRHRRRSRRREQRSAPRPHKLFAAAGREQQGSAAGREHVRSLDPSTSHSVSCESVQKRLRAAETRVAIRTGQAQDHFSYSGYMGHEKYTPFATMLAKHPERVIEKAVYGMLPKTALGRQILRRKLRVYPGSEHPHVAQQPTPLTFDKDEK